MYQVDLRAVWARLWALCRFGRRGAEPGVLLLVAVPQESEHSAQVAELFFASLHAFGDQPINVPPQFRLVDLAIVMQRHDVRRIDAGNAGFGGAFGPSAVF